ncbi:MAG: restriction endonuclease subunit S [Clostridia bacterium]|nr:restriction endonuclease subunit S [Clostridia bacterium]
MKTKTFLLKDIAKIDYGNKFDLQKMTFDNPNVNFISRTALNNGVSAIVDSINGHAPYPAGCVTIALGGSIGATFYQNKPFYTAQNVAVIQFEDNISQFAKLFLCQIIKFEVRNKFRAFGRELNKHIKTDFSVDLPIDDNGNPYWEYMDNFIKQLRYKKISSNNLNKDLVLTTIDWQEYKLVDYFRIVPGKYHPSDDYDLGDTPYISASNINNGISQYINLEPDFKGNCIITGKVGCTAFYQPNDFCATSDVNIFIPKNFVLNKYIGMFLVAVINKSENYKWNYGRQCRVGDSKEIIIKLPTKNNQPDWLYMEDYIKSLPYGDRI